MPSTSESADFSEDEGMPSEVPLRLEEEDDVAHFAEPGYLSVNSESLHRTRSYDVALDTASSGESPDPAESPDAGAWAADLTLTEDRKSIRLRSVRRSNPAFAE